MYYVRIGGGTVADTTDPSKQVAGYIYDTFKFAVDAGGEDEKPQVLIGNVDASEGAAPITLSDYGEVCLYILGETGTIKNASGEVNAVNYAAAAYCDGNNKISLTDYGEICLYILGENPTYVGTTVNLGTYDAQE